MATALIQNPAAFCMSSELHDFSWSTDMQEMLVRIYYQHPGNCLLETMLTPANGMVRIYQTRELVERFMRSRNLARMYPLTIVHKDGSNWILDAMITVIFCEKNLSLPEGGLTQWLERNFLSTRTVKRLPSFDEAVEQLYFVQPQGTPPNPSLHVTYVDGLGTVNATDIELTAEYNASIGNLYVCEFSIASLLSAIGDAVRIIGVTVSVGDRHMEFYRPDRRADIVFRFINAFNVMESAWLNAVVNRKTDDGRKIAHVDGRLAHYDRKPVTEYEVQTAPLSFEEAGWIDQLITSPEVALLDGTPVIVTDGTAECHNDNSELNAAKFSFKELDQRHTINTVQQAANIFTVPPHSYQFS